MIRPGFPPRPIPPVGVIPQLPRPPIPGIRGVPPIVTPMVRPVVPVVPPTEKPQTTVYVGKIAPTVDNEFLLSLLRLCGPVKSLKRAQDPSDGTPKGFGFCEFEAAEGVLRALRLLSKLNIDGQELVLKITDATRQYLELYVEKKTEREKLKETEAGTAEKDGESAAGAEKQEPPKLAAEEKEKDAEDSMDKENQENTQNFGIVTDEDREADRDALEKLTNMIEERLKTKPLPPPPPPVQTTADGSAKSNSEVPSKSRDGDSDVDIMKSDAAEDKNDDETTSENKSATDHEKTETSSPDKSRKHDSKSKDRDRERDLKREKERELERYERERERERVRRERERELKLREAERLYKERVKEWEIREREREYQRQYEKEREKERERERRREILKQEDDSDDDDSRKRRRRSSAVEEKRRKRQREKEDDLVDRLKEEEEIAEAKRRAIEEQPFKNDTEPPGNVIIESEKTAMQEEGKTDEGAQIAPGQSYEGVSGNGDAPGDGVYRNGSTDELTMGLAATTDMKQNNNVPTRKLGFGLIGSGRRTTVPSVFHEEDDEDVDEKKMRPLVPIDYSTEELQAVQSNASGAPVNLAAAAEFAKRISTTNSKEERAEMEKERSRRSNDRLSQRERDRNDDESTRGKDESKKTHDQERDREDKLKTENKKLLDAKQLIDMIPKTKEELFVYEINWDIYDKHELHERMRPWISKKITEFLGEEEATLVDYIVSCTKDHMRASKLLELLSSILDDEAEMFVLKMWRMLIFEIKKVETGLQLKSRV